MTEMNGNEAVSLLTIEHARELLQHHVARLNAEQYQIGRIISEVVDRRLAGVGSYESAMRQLGSAVRALSEGELGRAQAAARRFSEAVVLKYGTRRLGVLVRYGQKLRRQWEGAALDQLLMRVPGEDGYPREKPFPECTPEEVGRAVARDSMKAAGIVPRLDAYCVHLLREGIRKRFAEDSPASIKAFLREGRTHVTIKNVSVTELKMLAHAILDSTLPLDQAMYRETLPRREPSDALRPLTRPWSASGGELLGSP
ncbi:hypothetical protein [Hyalangium rubrum]|uniref:DUF222 domain-containing protein n=1 Tax=Hyalangium rubrum TaxID=3103134 RepID=A0ABU5HFX4_9BACT|nr:hypothetical protein [Hyalangium sp. s54d21]MDY7232155.1 hypothetical protein [Hyalangium sp. s54d21]